MSQIMTSPTGTNYMVFGDEDRKYELLESVDEKNTLMHNFELRVENSPNDTFAMFNVIVPQPVEISEPARKAVNTLDEFKETDQIYLIESANTDGYVIIGTDKTAMTSTNIPADAIVSAQEVTKEEVFAAGLTVAQREVEQLSRLEARFADQPSEGIKHLQKCLKDVEKDLTATEIDDFTRAVEEIKVPGGGMSV